MPRTNTSTAVTGWGVRVPGNHDVEGLWASLVAGECAGAIEVIPELPYEPRVAAARVSTSDSGCSSRLAALALPAVADALDSHPTLATTEPSRRAVVVATAFGPIGPLVEMASVTARDGMNAIGPRTVPSLMANRLAADISIAHQCEGPSYTATTACASGTDALGLGHRLILSGDVDLAIVCGVDAPLIPEVLAGFQRLSALSAETEDAQLACRPFDQMRTGFMMGEGAACVVLEADRDQSRLGRLLGYGASSDASGPVAPRSDGASAERAIRLAMERAAADVTSIGHVNAHGTGTILNDRVESAVVNRVLGSAVPTWSLKGSIGHLMGAAGVVEAIASWLALRDRVVPAAVGCLDVDTALPRIDVVHGESRVHDHDFAVSNSFAFGGHNACVVLGR